MLKYSAASPLLWERRVASGAEPPFIYIYGSSSRHFLPQRRRTRRHLSIFCTALNHSNAKTAEWIDPGVVWVSAPRIDPAAERRVHWAAPPRICDRVQTHTPARKREKSAQFNNNWRWRARRGRADDLSLGRLLVAPQPGWNRRRALITARARRMNPQVARCLSRACNPNPLAARAHIFVHQSHAPPQMLRHREGRGQTLCFPEASKSTNGVSIASACLRGNRSKEMLLDQSHCE
jgi:hypothetical protein